MNDGGRRGCHRSVVDLEARPRPPTMGDGIGLVLEAASAYEHVMLRRWFQWAIQWRVCLFAGLERKATALGHVISIFHGAPPDRMTSAESYAPGFSPSSRECEQR